MCRMVVYTGSCTRCGESFTWDELSQRLSCLEAKNNDAFGECKRGVQVETHSFDQECDTCAEEDEGVGGMEEESVEFEVPSKRGEEKAVDEEEEARRRRKRQRT